MFTTVTMLSPASGVGSMIGFWYLSFLTERENMNDFERIIADSMTDEDGREWITGYGDEADYIPGYDDGEWDPIMGDDEDWIDTDDQWLDDFQGEEDWG